MAMSHITHTIHSIILCNDYVVRGEVSVQDERMKQVSMNEELTPRVAGFALFISKQEEK